MLHVAPHRTGKRTQLPTPGLAPARVHGAPVSACASPFHICSARPGLCRSPPPHPPPPITLAFPRTLEQGGPGQGLRARQWPQAPAPPPRVSTWHLKRWHPWTAAERTLHKLRLSDKGRFERRSRTSCPFGPVAATTVDSTEGGWVGPVRPLSWATAGRLLQVLESHSLARSVSGGDPLWVAGAGRLPSVLIV